MNFDPTGQYQVRYFVVGFGERVAGPYSAQEVESQRIDIAGYEGVHGTWIEKVQKPTKRRVRDEMVRDKDNVGTGHGFLYAHVVKLRYDELLLREIPSRIVVGMIRPYWGHLGKTVTEGSRHRARVRKAARNYLGGALENYRCTTCGVAGVKLWREAESTHPLLCVDCAETNQATTHKKGWRSAYSRGAGDQIGLYLPAVPTEHGGYYTYTCLPEIPGLWWDLLPASPRRVAA